MPCVRIVGQRVAGPKVAGYRKSKVEEPVASTAGDRQTGATVTDAMVSPSKKIDCIDET